VRAHKEGERKAKEDDKSSGERERIMNCDAVRGVEKEEQAKLVENYKRVIRSCMTSIISIKRVARVIMAKWGERRGRVMKRKEVSWLAAAAAHCLSDKVSKGLRKFSILMSKVFDWDILVLSHADESLV
jgi:hypothetical protein